MEKSDENRGEVMRREKATDKSEMAFSLLLISLPWYANKDCDTKKIFLRNNFSLRCLDIVGRVDCGQLIISQAGEGFLAGRDGCKWNLHVNDYENLSSYSQTTLTQDDEENCVQQWMRWWWSARYKESKKRVAKSCSRTNKICKLNVIKIN